MQVKLCVQVVLLLTPLKYFSLCSSGYNNTFPTVIRVSLDSAKAGTWVDALCWLRRLDVVGWHFPLEFERLLQKLLIAKTSSLCPSATKTTLQATHQVPLGRTPTKDTFSCWLLYRLTRLGGSPEHLASVVLVSRLPWWVSRNVSTGLWELQFCIALTSSRFSWREATMTLSKESSFSRTLYSLWSWTDHAWRLRC